MASAPTLVLFSVPGMALAQLRPSQALPKALGGSSKREMKETHEKQNIGPCGGVSTFRGLHGSQGRGVWAGVCLLFAPHDSECVCFVGRPQPQGGPRARGAIAAPDFVQLFTAKFSRFTYMFSMTACTLPRHTLFLLLSGEGTRTNRRTTGPSDISGKRQKQVLGPATCLSSPGCPWVSKCDFPSPGPESNSGKKSKALW